MPVKNLEVINQIKRHYPGFTLNDLHNHSWYSDGWRNPTDILKDAAKSGLDTVTITDHDRVTDTDRILKSPTSHFSSIKSPLSSEISTLQGHILGYNLTKAIPPGKSVSWVLEDLHNQGAVAVAAHVNDPRTESISLNLVAEINRLQHPTIYFDGVEVANATTNPLIRESTLKLYLENPELFGAAIGGSDSHFDQIGRGLTISRSNIVDAIQSRQTIPFITGIPDNRNILALIRFGLICAYWSTILQPARKIKAQNNLIAKLLSQTNPAI